MSCLPYIDALRPFVEILVDVADDDYRGDYFVLASHEYKDSYYFITGGYGSCSGCDAWEDADGSPAEQARLIVNLLEQAKCFNSLDEAKAYIAATEDRALEWYGNVGKAWADFQAQVSAVTE